MVYQVFTITDTETLSLLNISKLSFLINKYVEKYVNSQNILGLRHFPFKILTSFDEYFSV